MTMTVYKLEHSQISAHDHIIPWSFAHISKQTTQWWVKPLSPTMTSANHTSAGFADFALTVVDQIPWHFACQSLVFNKWVWYAQTRRRTSDLQTSLIASRFQGPRKKQMRFSILIRSGSGGSNWWRWPARRAAQWHWPSNLLAKMEDQLGSQTVCSC